MAGSARAALEAACSGCGSTVAAGVAGKFEERAQGQQSCRWDLDRQSCRLAPHTPVLLYKISLGRTKLYA